MRWRGLVLIDELDLYLHPLWQVGLVRALKATFPRVQFIVTTHSPMLLPGLERDEIIHLKLDDAGNQLLTRESHGHCQRKKSPSTAIETGIELPTDRR